jgi:hypothetical protein
MQGCCGYLSSTWLYCYKEGVSLLYLSNVILMMHGENFFFDAQSRTHFREGTRNQPKPPLLIAHRPQYFAVALYPPPVVHVRAEPNFFCLFVSVNPGRMRLVYMQKSGCDLSQLKIVCDEHQSPVSFATLAYEREHFPPFSFCKAFTTASLITLCFARWSRAFFSYGTLSAGETSSHCCW